MLGSIIFGFLLSAVKYFFGAGFCIGAFPDNHLLSFAVSSLGGITGMILFTYGEAWLNEHVFKKYFFKKARRFSKWNRFLIKLKYSGGLPLVAFLTPIILTIPVGSLLATSFIHNRKKIVLYMAISVLLWGTFIFGSLELLGFNFQDWFKSLF